MAFSYHVRAQPPYMNAIVIPRTWFLLPVPSTKIANILDRRNELAGNLSLEQELRYIRKINELVRERRINELVDDDPPSGNKQEYRYVEVREPIENRRPLDYATKLDRSPRFIREMMAYGEEQAEEFLNGLLRSDRQDPPKQGD